MANAEAFGAASGTMVASTVADCRGNLALQGDWSWCLVGAWFHGRLN